MKKVQMLSGQIAMSTLMWKLMLMASMKNIVSPFF